MERVSNSKLARINQEEYAPFSTELKHVFLVGDLQKPCPHPFIRDERVEIIFCDYLPGDHGRRHWHEIVTEYEFVVAGEVGIFEIRSGETHWFGAGDFIVVPAGECVQRLVRERTMTVAIKVPSSAEKIHCDACARLCAYRVAAYKGTDGESK